MFSIFRRNEKVSFSFLGTDMHSHLIPGIDDGSKSVEDSLQLIQELMRLGYKKIITTPHIMGEYYPNSPESIKAGLLQVKEALQKENLEIEIQAAAEYYVDDYFRDLLATGDSLLTFSGNHLLIEFSMLGESVNPAELIFDLKTRGYQPVLAHPERYLYYADRFHVFEEAKAQGCKLQVNLLSLAGHYGAGQKKLGIKLIEAGLVDFLGTDLHRESHIQKIQSVFKDRKVRKLLSKGRFQNHIL